MTEHDAKDVRAPALAIGQNDRRTRAEIDLGFFSRCAFQPAERQDPSRPQATHIATDAVVLAGKTVLDHQVLVDPLGSQALIQLAENDLAERLAQARLEPPAVRGRK